MSILLYDMNDDPVMITTVEIDILRQQFLFTHMWYHYEAKWTPINVASVKSFLMYFLKTLDLHINTFMDKNYYVLKELLYRNPSFDPPHLLCFNNGTYDLQIHEFKHSYWSDYCTLSCGYDYLPCKPNHDHRRLVRAMYFIFIGKPLTIYGQISDEFYQFVQKLFGQYVIAQYDQRNTSYRCLLNKSPIKMLTNKVVVCSLKQANGCLLSAEEMNVKSNVNTIMHQLITLDQIPIKDLLFKRNNIFINDITNYILTILYDLV